MPPMNPWDDLGEYRDTIKECLFKEISKSTVKNEPTVNDPTVNNETNVGGKHCIGTPELQWDSPEVMEGYRKKMEVISPDCFQKLAGVLEVCAETVWLLSG